MKVWRRMEERATRKEGDHHGDGDQEREKNTADLPKTCCCPLQKKNIADISVEM